MRKIAALLIVASLPVFGAAADERPAKQTRQQQNAPMPLVLFEGRQAATVVQPQLLDQALTLKSYSPRDIEELWFARAEFRGHSGGGGGGGE
jgi:hypothetical protein